MKLSGIQLLLLTSALSFANAGCKSGDGGVDNEGGSSGSSIDSGRSGGTKAGGSAGSKSAGSKSGGSAGSSQGGSAGTTMTGGSGGKTTTGSAGGSVTGGSGSGGAAATGGAFVLPNVAPTIPTEGLVAYWKFDEGTGTKITDSSANANHGTVVKGSPIDTAAHPTPPWETGIFGKALHFNGVTDWVRVPTSATIDSPSITNKLTIAAWVKWENNTQSWSMVVQRSEGTTRAERWALGQYQGLSFNEIGYVVASGIENLPVNNWTHMALTFDGTVAHGYENGVEVAMMPVANPIKTGQEPVSLGCGMNFDAITKETCSEFFKGWMDEVVIYNRFLSAAEINALAGQ